MPRGADLGQIYVGIFLPTPRAESVEPNFRTKFSRYATQSASKFCQIPPPRELFHRNWTNLKTHTPLAGATVAQATY